jgi:excisionase family DNA binding protein
MMLSARSLAERWDCHRDTIYKMIERGDLPCRRIAGMVRIPLDAVEAIEGGRAWQGGLEDTGQSSGGSLESGGSAGLRIVANGPEALAQQMKPRPTSGSTGLSPSSISRLGPRRRP